MKERTSTKAEYRSAIRSRRMIREAYMELLKEKDLSKITVTDIIKRADLNRATFYAHYPDVRGVTEEIENEIIEKMLEVLKEFQFTSFFRNPAPLLLKISRYLEEDTDFYRILVRANGSEIFMEKLKRCFPTICSTTATFPSPCGSQRWWSCESAILREALSISTSSGFAET